MAGGGSWLRGSRPTSCCRHRRLRLRFVPCRNATRGAGGVLPVRPQLAGPESCPVPPPRAQAFLLGQQKLLGSAVLPWPKSKEAKRGLAGSIHSPLSLLPPPPQGRDADASREGVQQSSSFPAVLPGLGTTHHRPVTNTGAVWRSLGLVFTPGSPVTSHLQPGEPRCPPAWGRGAAGDHLETTWRPRSPAGPGGSRLGLSGFALSKDLCHPSPSSGFPARHAHVPSLPS